MRASVRGMCLSLVCAVAVLVTSSSVRASEAVVTTYDGRTLTGELLSQDESTVTLMISGIKTPIPGGRSRAWKSRTPHASNTASNGPNSKMTT